MGFSLIEWLVDGVEFLDGKSVDRLHAVLLRYVATMKVIQSTCIEQVRKSYSSCLQESLY